jgi:hypothetical protein
MVDRLPVTATPGLRDVPEADAPVIELQLAIAGCPLGKYRSRASWRARFHGDQVYPKCSQDLGMWSHLQHGTGPDFFLDLKSQVVLEIEIKVQNGVYVDRDPVWLPMFQCGNNPLS